MDAYRALVDEAERDNQGFWARLARGRPTTHAPFYRWFGDGRLNASFNCLDRHVASGLGERTAIVFEADDGAVTPISYRALLARRLTGQRHEGLRHPARRPGGDLPAHVGRGHRRHAGLQPDRRDPLCGLRRLLGQVAERTHRRHRRPPADHRGRAGARRDAAARASPTKRWPWAAATACAACSCTAAPAPGSTGTRRATPGCTKPPAPSPNTASPNGWTRSIRCSCFTSGSTGKPKGVQHATAGYLLWAAQTLRWTFDLKPDDVFWCTADIGWITGHTYVAYAPLLCGTTQLVYEGHAPRSGPLLAHDRPAPVSIFYTAPTAIRALIKARTNIRTRIPGTTGLTPCACSARRANPSTRRSGAGITRKSARAAARSWTPGGRPRPAAR